MDIDKIVALIATGSDLFEHIMNIVDDVRENLSLDDEEKLDTALRALQDKNDGIASRILLKLETASREG